MSKKKTPQEKKEASYDKDHYTFAWLSPRGFRKTWKKKKNYVNRVLRRKSKGLLHEVEKSSHNPEDDSFTAEAFRKGLIRKRVRKTGVVTVREKVEKKRDHREGRSDRKARERFVQHFRGLVFALLNDKEYKEETLLGFRRMTMGGDFLKFLEKEPFWQPKIEQWLVSFQKRAVWRQSEQRRRKHKATGPRKRAS
jgi:hypothetical protein